jgi:hypothetical protein
MRRREKSFRKSRRIAEVMFLVKNGLRPKKIQFRITQGSKKKSGIKTSTGKKIENRKTNEEMILILSPTKIQNPPSIPKMICNNSKISKNEKNSRIRTFVNKGRVRERKLSSEGMRLEGGLGPCR